MSDVDDKLRRIAAGDGVAAAWLYDTFASPLYRRLRSRYGYVGGADLDDLLQDTFLQVLRRKARVLVRWLDRQGHAPSEASLEQYLWDLACGLATNRRRAASRSNVVSIETTKPLVEEAEAERAVLGRDMLIQLDACLEASNTRTYLYYKLRHVDGLTPDEIAQATGWSKKSTYKRKQLLDQAVERCVDQLGIG